MAKSTFQIVAILAAVALVGTLALTVRATVDDNADHGGGFLRHLHSMGHHLHGGGHDRDAISGLIEQLDLTPDQQRRLEKVHEILGAEATRDPGSMADLHDRLVAQFERGRIETDEIRGLIDRHVEQLRHTAYAVTDELIALVNELDATQREVVLAHIREHHAGDHDHHR